MTKRGVDGDRGGSGPIGGDPGVDRVPDRPSRCRWCRKVLQTRTGRGRPREFCSQRCRQWDWVSRQRADELELSENELIIARDQLDALHDDLYVLACAVDDARRDLAAPGRRTATELRDVVDWLLDAAGPLRDRELGASPSSRPQRP